MRDQRLIRLEEDLQRVPGIRSARVVGVEKPSEIHIVSDSERSPKQLVRDVQSLASAGFGLPIDHRIVSVVQLDNVDIREEQHAAARLVLQQVVVAHRREKPWVRVTLAWPEGGVTEGAAYASDSREGKAAAAAEAAVRALAQRLQKRGARLAVEQVQIQRLGPDDSVVVRIRFDGSTGATPLVGSAIIQDDAAAASVHAVLQAVNRRVELQR